MTTIADTDQTPSTVSARGVDDLLGYIGHCLGGMPTDSVVLVSLHGRTLRAGARFDVPDAALCQGAGRRRWAQTVAATLARDAAADGCLAVLLQPAAGADAHRPLAPVLREALADAGVPLAAAWVVQDGVSWAWTGEDERILVGADARPRTVRDPRLSEVSLAMTTEGSSFADDWPLEDVPRPDPGKAPWPAPAAVDADDRRAWLALWADVLDGRREVGPMTLRRLAGPLVHRGWRDALVVLAAHGSDEEGRELVTATAALPHDDVYLADTGHRPCWERLDALRQALRGAAAAAPADVAVEALVLAGWISWARGHGTAAGRHLDAALQSNPRHRLGGLLRQVLDRGLVAGWACDPATAWHPGGRRRTDGVA